MSIEIPRTDSEIPPNREIPKLPFFFVASLRKIIPVVFIDCQQPSIFSTGVAELPDPSGKFFSDLCGAITTTLSVAFVDHQTDARSRQKKLVEVVVDPLRSAPFALRNQGSCDHSTGVVVFEPSDIVEPFPPVAVGLVHLAPIGADFEAQALANLAQLGQDGLGPAMSCASSSAPASSNNLTTCTPSAGDLPGIAGG